jgi:hypothetical protein
MVNSLRTAALGLEDAQLFRISDDGLFGKEKAGRVRPVLGARINLIDYFSELLMEVNFSFNCVPRPFTAAMIASEMPAAISPYSIAVAPDSSLQKPRNNAFISFLPRFP